MNRREARTPSTLSAAPAAGAERGLHRHSLMALAVAATFASAAGAQTQSGAATAAAANLGNAAQDAPATQEVVVTATRRTTTLLKTPLAISAVSGDALARSGTDNALKLGDVVPNVQIERSIGTQISIRGVSNENSLEGGDPSAAYNVDGIYIARQQAQGGSFFDLERIEVLRGPQGTLYGRNATGGAINLIPNKPGFQREGTVSMEFGNFNAFRFSGMLNTPLTQDLALRVAVSTNRRDSVLLAGPATTAGANARLGSNQDDVNYRVQALYRFGPDHSVRLSIDGTENRALPPMQVPLASFYQVPSTAPVPNAGLFGGTWRSPGSDEVRTVNWNPSFTGQNNEHDRGITLEYNQDLGPAQLTYLFGDRRHHYYKREPVFFFSDLTGVVADRAQPFDATQTSHELRLTSKASGALTWVAGLYHFKEHTDISTLFVQPLPPQLSADAGTFAYNYRNEIYTADAKSTAVFGQATYSLTPEARLTLGLRRTQDSKTRGGAKLLSVAPTFNPASDVSLLNQSDVSYKRTNYKLGGEYDINKDVMAFASLSTAYKAGGANNGCMAGTSGCSGSFALPASQLYYAPEDLKAYELGLKGRLLNRALSFSASLFKYQYRNMQLQGLEPTSGAVVTRNAASSSINGMELEGSYRLNNQHKFNASLALLDAKYDDYQVNAGTNFAGKALDRSPKRSLTLGYENTIGLASGASLVSTVATRITTRSEFTFFGGPFTRFEVPGYHKSSAMVTYNEPQGIWYVQGFVNNIENHVQPQGWVIGGTFLTEPRTYGVRMGARF